MQWLGENPSCCLKKESTHPIHPPVTGERRPDALQGTDELPVVECRGGGGRDEALAGQHADVDGRQLRGEGVDVVQGGVEAGRRVVGGQDGDPGGSGLPLALAAPKWPDFLAPSTTPTLGSTLSIRWAPATWPDLPEAPAGDGCAEGLPSEGRSQTEAGDFSRTPGGSSRTPGKRCWLDPVGTLGVEGPGRDRRPGWAWLAPGSWPNNAQIQQGWIFRP